MSIVAVVNKSEINLANLLESNLDWQKAPLYGLPTIVPEKGHAADDQMEYKKAFTAVDGDTTFTVIKGIFCPGHPIGGEETTYTHFAVISETGEENPKISLSDGRVPSDLVKSRTRSIQELIYNKASGLHEGILTRFISPISIDNAQLEAESFPERPVEIIQ